MPTAPLTPQQPASVNATPELSIPAPIEAFGGAIGHAISGLGTAVEKSGDEIWQRAMQLQDLQNRSEVDKADAQYMETAGKIHADFSSLQGENATKAFPKYIQDLKAAREGLRDGLSNPMVQKMYDSQTLSTMGRTIFNGAGYAGTQAKVARYDTLNAKQTSLISMAATSNDPATVEAVRGRLGAVVAEKHALKGTPDAASDEMMIVNSSLNSNVVTHKAFSDPVGAFDDLEKLHDEGKLTSDDYDKAYSKIAPRRMAQLVDNTANDVWNSGVKGGEQQKSLKEMQDAVREKMKAIAPDDSLAQQHAVNQLEHIYNQDKSAMTAEKNQNIQTIDAAIATGEVKSDRDLMNNPATAHAYDNLPASIKTALPAKINGYKRAVDENENQQNYTKLVGMARSGDPDAVAQFMDTDIMTQKINEPAKRALLGLRDQILKHDAVDSRVSRAMGWLRGGAGSQLEALKIYRRNKDDPDDYDHFVGSLHLALEDWQTTHGKPASQQDVIEKIGPTLLKGRGDAGWFSRETHEFNSPPQEIVDQLQAAAVKRNEPPLSDRELQRIYVQALLKKHYPSAKQSQDAAK
jgi:hypothetical protein